MARFGSMTWDAMPQYMLALTIGPSGSLTNGSATKPEQQATCRTTPFADFLRLMFGSP
jgi:hypothetical protein